MVCTASRTLVPDEAGRLPPEAALLFDTLADAVVVDEAPEEAADELELEDPEALEDDEESLLSSEESESSPMYGTRALAYCLQVKYVFTSPTFILVFILVFIFIFVLVLIVACSWEGILACT